MCINCNSLLNYVLFGVRLRMCLISSKKPAKYLPNATEYSKQVKFMTSKRRKKCTEFVGNKFLNQKYDVVYKIKHIIFFMKYFIRFIRDVVILRDYYLTFSISPLVSARYYHIKPDSEASGLIWVASWYQGRYGEFHVIIYLSHFTFTFFKHWLLYCRKDLWTDKLRT